MREQLDGTPGRGGHHSRSTRSPHTVSSQLAITGNNSISLEYTGGVRELWLGRERLLSAQLGLPK